MGHVLEGQVSASSYLFCQAWLTLPLLGIAAAVYWRRTHGYRAAGISMAKSDQKPALDRSSGSLLRSRSWEYPAILRGRILPGMLLFKRSRVAATTTTTTTTAITDVEDDGEVCESAPKKQRMQEDNQTRFLDLPELALDNILLRLSPEGLTCMGCVCKELRSRCRESDYFWKTILDKKWGKLAGSWMYTERKSEAERQLRHLKWLWPFSLLPNVLRRSPPRDSSLDSLIGWFWAVESGNVSFPVQVFNRQYGHVGFLMSCYDAEVTYVRCIDSFTARYPPMIGAQDDTLEDCIPWERIRPPLETPSKVLHVSDCLAELKPGDHIEVQWRRKQTFPFGWWYGVVGHSDYCSNTTSLTCACRRSEIVWLVFEQYTSVSKWRRAAINRVSHSETGSDTIGFYGGIRKLRTEEEIAVWEKFRPDYVLE